jgi:catechol 2,3-dioxygenase-like lactoylglutathione lyase family enzyme
MTTTQSTKFELLGYNHVALVCSDMQKTVDFYEGILGFPLIKTLGYLGGGQHFFFQVTENDGVAFFYATNPPPPSPGVVGADWERVKADAARNPAAGHVGGTSAPRSMHHLTFDVPVEMIDEYREKLAAAGVEVTDVVRRSDDSQGNGEEEFVRSIYFPDPDGIVLEFAGRTRPLNEKDVRHTPVQGARG